MDEMIFSLINEKDSEIANLIKKENNRQNQGLELIASENYPSKEVRAACGSILTAKYSEGYPGKRYYGGCEFIDEIENLAINRACSLFGAKYANVQPHSGSQANAAAYRALEVILRNEGKLADDRKMKILTVQLNDGGHLTHGSPVSFSSHQYDFCFFPLDETGHINFDFVEKAIIEYKPDVLMSGYSAYPYAIDFSKFKELADKYNLKFIVDMAHIAGLVAAGLHQSPVPYADIVTTTTHKTLRGTRAGLILTNDEELAKKINSAVFPYYQGGALQHIVAAKAICFKEAMSDEFKNYMRQVIDNTKAFTNKIKELGCVCSDTDNHLMLLDVKSSFGITGKDAQNKLEEIGITTNKNMIPNDTEKPNVTSGLRIGFAALTSRGATIEDAKEIAVIIYNHLSNLITSEKLKEQVNKIATKLKPIESL